MQLLIRLTILALLFWAYCEFTTRRRLAGVKAIAQNRFPGEYISAIRSRGFMASEYPYSSPRVVVYHTVEMPGHTEMICTDAKGNLFQPTLLTVLR